MLYECMYKVCMMYVCKIYLGGIIVKYIGGIGQYVVGGQTF